MFIRLETACSTVSSTWQDGSNEEHYAFRSDNSSLFLMKRSAQPCTYAYVDSRDTLRFGYQTLHGYEYLHGSVTATGDLIIERDCQSALPLFYREDNGSLTMSNEYAALRDRPIELNLDQLINSIYMLGDKWETLDSNVRILSPNVTMRYGQEGIQIVRNQTRQEISGMSDPNELPARLSSRLQHRFAEYDVSEAAILSSGGLDSSAVAICAARSGYPVRLFSAQFEAVYQASQQAKLEALAAFTAGTLHVTPYNEHQHAPLTRFLGTPPYPAYENDEIYTEIINSLAMDVRERGHSVIFTGIGGDELFLDESPELELSQGPQWKRFARDRLEYSLSGYTDELAEAYIDRQPNGVHLPLDVLAISVYGTYFTSNNIFIEQGVWPAAPLADQELYDYARGLEQRHRADKNILRAWYKALDAPSVLHDRTGKNEHFDTILYTTIDRIFEQRSLELGGLSRLAEAGIVAKGDQAYLQKAPPVVKYQLLMTEQNLRV